MFLSVFESDIFYVVIDIFISFEILSANAPREKQALGIVFLFFV
jgi:hypothetical protein